MESWQEDTTSSIPDSQSQSQLLVDIRKKRVRALDALLRSSAAAAAMLPSKSSFRPTVTRVRALDSLLQSASTTSLSSEHSVDDVVDAVDATSLSSPAESPPMSRRKPHRTARTIDRARARQRQQRNRAADAPDPSFLQHWIGVSMTQRPSRDADAHNAWSLQTWLHNGIERKLASDQQ